MAVYGDSGKSLWGLKAEYMVTPFKSREVMAFKAKDGKDRVIIPMGTYMDGTRSSALKNLALSPFLISINAVTRVFTAIADIFSGGQISVRNQLVDNTWKGRLKAVGCSIVSILATPASVALDAASFVAHVINPSMQKIDLLREHMWCGFVMAKSEKPGKS